MGQAGQQKSRSRHCCRQKKQCQWPHSTGLQHAVSTHPHVQAAYNNTDPVARLILHCSRSKELHIMTLAAKLGCSTCTTYSDQLGCKCARQSCKPHMTWESACIKPIVVRSLEFMEVSVSSFSAMWRTTHHHSSTTPCIVASHCVAAWLRMRFSVYAQHRNINVSIDDL
jgi:hypothetical protein